MKTEINMGRVKRILSGEPVGGENKRWLFYYSLFTYVADGKAQTLTESEAGDKLKEFPSMPVTVFKLQKSETETPKILKGRKGLKTQEVTSTEQICGIISSTTGVGVEVTDLLPKDSRPLNVRVRAFMVDVTRRQQTKTRILNQLKNR